MTATEPQRNHFQQCLCGRTDGELSLRITRKKLRGYLLKKAIQKDKKQISSDLVRQERYDNLDLDLDCEGGGGGGVAVSNRFTAGSHREAN